MQTALQMAEASRGYRKQQPDAARNRCREAHPIWIVPTIHFSKNDPAGERLRGAPSPS